MKRFACGCLLPLFSALLPPDARAEDCDPRFVQSQQFAASDCRFQNPPNPDAKPHRTSWEIWTRFLVAKKQGTVPVDPIPVRMLDRAALDALDVTSNHIIRLGHSSHLLKLYGKWWLIDPVFGSRASPVSWAGPMRFHAPPVALPDAERDEVTLHAVLQGFDGRDVEVVVMVMREDQAFYRRHVGQRDRWRVEPHGPRPRHG